MESVEALRVRKRRVGSVRDEKVEDVKVTVSDESNSSGDELLGRLYPIYRRGAGRRKEESRSLPSGPMERGCHEVASFGVHVGSIVKQVSTRCKLSKGRCRKISPKSASRKRESCAEDERT
jgi:hypothetical protein